MHSGLPPIDTRSVVIRLKSQGACQHMKHRHDEVEYRHQVDLPGRGRREHETVFISQILDLTYAYHLSSLQNVVNIR
jgi:hypothetical protein